jgi:transposase
VKNKKSKYVQLIELYNSGKTNVDELKIELNSTKKTIYTYIYQANKEGKIIKLKKHKEKKRKISKYVQFIELYNLGVTDLDELEEKLESPKSSIYSYIHRAHKEGKIVKVPRKKKEKKKRINKYELFVKLYNSGIKETKHLMAELQISKNTVYVYTRRAQKEKKIFKIDRNTEKNIIKQLITQYPFEVALNLNLQPEIIYKYLENLGEKDQKTLQREILSQNAIWKKIKSLKVKYLKNNQEISVEESLKKIIPKLKKTEVFELIKFYYWCGKESMALQVINQIIYFAENSKEIKQQAQLEKDKLLREIMVKKIISRKGTTYSSLCKELNVRESFLIQILGREDEDR